MTSYQLSKPQLNRFNTFGYLSLPGLMSNCIQKIIDAFEEVWAERGGGHHGQSHDGKRRSCIVPFIDQHERLCALDGNYYAGDTNWHSDGYTKQIRYTKIAFYLDHLTRDTGCLRVIPGSHRQGEEYSETLEADARNSEEAWGLKGSEVPAVALETEPGDIVVFQHNLKHAAFGGSERRRMFTINCCERVNQDQIPMLRKNLEGLARFWVDRAYGEKMIATANDQRMVHLEQVLANDDHLAALSAKAREEMEEPSRG